MYVCMYIYIHNIYIYIIMNTSTEKSSQSNNHMLLSPHFFIQNEHFLGQSIDTHTCFPSISNWLINKFLKQSLIT